MRMRMIHLIPFLFALPAFAQSASPMLVVGGQQPTAAAKPASELEQERLINQFPDWAVTRVGSATGGWDKDVVPAPAAPANPAGANISPNAQAPAAPAAPEAPDSPITKLWPVDTVPIFLRSCIGYRPALLVPCKCVIGRLMTEMPHDEFLELTAKGTIEQDARLKNIRLQCAVQPQPRQ